MAAMGLFIKNAGVEEAARELARLKGQSLTEAVGDAVKTALEAERTKPARRPTVPEMIEATDRFRKAVGLDKRKVGVSKTDFDTLWDFADNSPNAGNRS